MAELIHGWILGAAFTVKSRRIPRGINGVTVLVITLRLILWLTLRIDRLPLIDRITHPGLRHLGYWLLRHTSWEGWGCKRSSHCDRSYLSPRRHIRSSLGLGLRLIASVSRILIGPRRNHVASGVAHGVEVFLSRCRKPRTALRHRIARGYPSGSRRHVAGRVSLRSGRCRYSPFYKVGYASQTQRRKIAYLANLMEIGDSAFHCLSYLLFREILNIFQQSFTLFVERGHLLSECGEVSLVVVRIFYVVARLSALTGKVQRIDRLVRVHFLWLRFSGSRPRAQTVYTL